MNKIIYCVYARFNNKPAGYYASFLTKEQAEQFRKKQQLACVIKRERVSFERYEILKKQ